MSISSASGRTATVAADVQGEGGNDVRPALIHLRRPDALHLFAHGCDHFLIEPETDDAKFRVTGQVALQTVYIFIYLIEVSVCRIGDVGEHVHVRFGDDRLHGSPRRRERHEHRDQDVQDARSDVMPVAVVLIDRNAKGDHERNDEGYGDQQQPYIIEVDTAHNNTPSNLRRIPPQES